MKRTLSFVLMLSMGIAFAGERPRAGQRVAAEETVPAAPAPVVSAPGAATTNGTQTTARAAPAAASPQEPQEPSQTPADAAQTTDGGKVVPVPGSKALGMSILGNQEAPTSLVIVPWKTSELGDSLGVSTLLDDSKGPVDKDVFMRSLRYYEIRSEPKTKP
jgi:hypothetical protein